jgi:hypothetical protein
MLRQEREPLSLDPKAGYWASKPSAATIARGWEQVASGWRRHDGAYVEFDPFASEMTGWIACMPGGRFISFVNKGVTHPRRFRTAENAIRGIEQIEEGASPERAIQTIDEIVRLALARIDEIGVEKLAIIMGSSVNAIEHWRGVEGQTVGVRFLKRILQADPDNPPPPKLRIVPPPPEDAGEQAVRMKEATYETVSDILGRHCAGEKARHIADQLNMKRSAVRLVLRNHGFTPRRG